MAKTGWVIDFADIDAAVKPLVALLDHTYLNDMLGLENPTAEMLALWFTQLKGTLEGLSRVEVQETDRGGAVWTSDVRAP